MNVKFKNYRKIIIILLFFSVIILFPVESSAYFDKFQFNNPGNATIGDWSKEASNTNIIEEIKKEAVWIDDKNIDDDYLVDLIFDNYDPENPEDAQINPLYNQYTTMDEIKEVISLIKEFTESFLEVNGGEPVFKPYVEVVPVDLNITSALLPGENTQIYQVLQTADATSESPNGWIPIMLSLSIESTEGYDLSDFAVELLIDGNAFALTNPMSYRYVLYDAYSGGAKNRVQSDRISVSSFNKKVTNEIIYNTRIKEKVNNVYNDIMYKHKLTVPTIGGNWNRITGPNYYLGEPINTQTNHQTFYGVKNDSFREGMVLNGSSDGKQVEMRVEIPNRNPQDTYVIPIVINISRGLRTDENPNSTDPVLPNVKIKVVKGSHLWD